MTTPTKPKLRSLAWLLLAVVIALGYLFQLGGDHIPRNGDELVYAHIARLTAESGHWLPLVSSYDFMRNTKPPLLFWQAMLAGGWGDHWTLFNLRLPSVIYLWGTALMVGLLVRKVVMNSQAGSPALQAAALSEPGPLHDRPRHTGGLRGSAPAFLVVAARQPALVSIR